MINLGGFQIGAADINACGKEYLRTDAQKQADKNTDAAIEQNAANVQRQFEAGLKGTTVPTTAQLTGVKGENAKIDEAGGALATAKGVNAVTDGVASTTSLASAAQTGGGSGHSSGGGLTG